MKWKSKEIDIRISTFLKNATMSSKHLGHRPVCCFFSAILTNESLRINSKGVEDLEIGGGVRAIPLSLGKSSNVETF